MKLLSTGRPPASSASRNDLSRSEIGATSLPSKKTISLRRKLLLLPLLYLAGLIILQLANFYTNREVSEKVIFPGFAEQTLAGSANLIKETVDIEAAVLAARVAPLKTREEQIAAIIAETDPIRFFADKSGYFFTYELNGVRINVPINKSGNGKNMTDQVDQKGVRYVEGLLKAARQGGGFVKYSFEKEGKGVQPKLAYATRIPGTDYMVGTGVYVDNVEAELAKLRAGVEARTHEYLILTIALFGVVLTVTIVASVWISESTGRSIRAAISRLAANAEQNTASATAVSDASRSLAEGASEQAASLEETSSTLEEMSSMAQRNADSATKANELTGSARRAADGGAADMRAMSNAMLEIKTSSDDIAKIIKTIDEIAFQTNILALNAAVEAARAGEAGAGFAVVADEVRALAQRSAVAARETAEKIEGAIGKTAQGVQMSEQVKKRLEEIVDQVRQVDGLVSEVATASKEQNEGVQQINKAISQIDQVVQSNAANAEESAAAAEELRSQADALSEIIGTLERLVGGRGKAAAEPMSAEPRPRPAPTAAREEFFATAHH